ncbi:plasmid stabilization protein [Streptomyces sp. CC228A]|uniref:plasmid stabilization protein n=1 Tax=Streptomyces sp. CC228A TaxID=2898186 RepID=UPI001F3D8A3B|nr:plasmid stabilization protein [Streptomyces sp. CC228A]
MPAGSSSKRERQYEHIKEGAVERGESEKRAKEIAARTVNKERARSGEAKTSSKSSKRGPSPSERGGRRSSGGSGGQTYDELYEEAKRRDVHGRSSMNKAELQRELGKG